MLKSMSNRKFWQSFGHCLELSTGNLRRFRFSSTSVVDTRRVRRAVLYLQGFDQRKIQKASSHPDLDCACLDMEDGVAWSKKEEARHTIVETLQNVEFGRTERMVRINSLDSEWGKKDLDAVLKSSYVMWSEIPLLIVGMTSVLYRVLPDSIVIPKVRGRTQNVSQEFHPLK